MKIGNAFATAMLRCRQDNPADPWHIEITVWNRSYDDPIPGRRNSLITGVSLLDLPPGQGGSHWRTISITDRYGTDVTNLWATTSGSHSVGYMGYREYAGGPSVWWSCFTGIYDERCLEDRACDALRLQTYLTAVNKIGVFDYLLGPVTFRFTLEPFSPATGVRIQITQQFIGGNGGNPANHGNPASSENFMIQFG